MYTTEIENLYKYYDTLTILKTKQKLKTFTNIMMN